MKELAWPISRLPNVLLSSLLKQELERKKVATNRKSTLKTEAMDKQEAESSVAEHASFCKRC